MYVVNTALTITWAITSTTEKTVAQSLFDVAVIAPNGTVTYNANPTTGWIEPTKTVVGSATFTYTPTDRGKYKILLVTGSSSSYTILDTQEITVFCGIPSAKSCTRVLPTQVINYTCPTFNVVQGGIDGINDDSADAIIWAFEVTKAGNFDIVAGINDIDALISLFDQSGTLIPPNEDSEGTSSTEVMRLNLGLGIYQILVEEYFANTFTPNKHAVCYVAPSDGIGMLGGTAGTATAQHSGLAYVGRVINLEPTISIPALTALPPPNSTLVSQHGAVGWMDGTTNVGHVWTFTVGTTGTITIIVSMAGMGVNSPNQPMSPDLAWTLYDSAGAVKIATVNDWVTNPSHAFPNDPAFETRLDTNLTAGTYQLHVHQPQPYTPVAIQSGGTFGVWIADLGLNQVVGRNINTTETGVLTQGLIYKEALSGNLTPGAL